MNRNKIPHILPAAPLTAAVMPRLCAQTVRFTVRRRSIWLLVVWLALGAIVASGQTTWVGGGLNGNISSSTNWPGGTHIPTLLHEGDILVFGDAPQTAVLLDSTELSGWENTIVTIGLVFPSSTAAYSFTGVGAPTYTIYIYESVATTATNSNPIVFNNTVSLALSSEGPVVFDTTAGSEIKVFSNIVGNRLQKAGAGTLTLSGDNTYTGTTTISGGTLAVYSLANGGAASGIGSSSNAAANLVLDGGTLRYLGGATTTDRLFTLGTTGGTLDASGTASLTFSNIESVVLSGTNTARTLTLTGSNNIDTTTFNPILGDNGTGATSLVKNGVARWTLNGTNTYSGGTTINAGTLIATNATGSATGTGPITINSGILQIGPDGADGTVGSVSGNIVNNGAVTFNRSNAITYSEVITGTGAVRQTGSGTLTLYGANTYTGSTTINSGVVEINSLGYGGSASGIGASSNAATNLVLDGGTLRYTGNNTDTDRLFTLGPNGGTIDASNPTVAGFLFFSNTGSIALTGTNTPRTLILTGTPGYSSTAYLYPQLGDNGTGATSVHLLNGSFWRLAAANTYSGGTTIDSGGTLVAINSTGSATGTGIVTINSGGRLVIGSNSPSGMIGGNIVNNGQIEYNRSDNYTYGGVISGSGILWDGMPNQTFTLTGANTFTGATTIYGTVVVTSLANGGSASGIGASSNAAANLVLNGGTLRYIGGAASTDRLFTLGTTGGTLDASVTDSLTFSNIGSVVLSGTNTARTLTLAGSDVGVITFKPILGDNGTGATSLVKNDLANWALSSANTYSGGTTINGGFLIADNTTGSATGTGAITINGGTLQIGTNSTTGSVSGNIVNNGAVNFNRGNAITYGGTISGTGRLDNNGSGTLTLSGVNTYSGSTKLIGGSLTDGAASRFSPNSAIYINTGMNLDAGFNETVAGLSDYTPGTAGTVGAAATLTIDNAVNYTFSGAISGAGSLVKSGVGTQTLGSTNTYTGTTTINSGTLAVYGLTNGGAASGIGSSSNAAANLVLNGGALQYLGGAATTDRLFTLGASGGTLDASGTASLTFSNTGSVVLSGTNTVRTLTLTGSDNIDTTTFNPILSDNGTGATSLVKNDLARWNLTGANTYSGGTTINGGTLVAGSNSAFGSGSVMLNGGSLIVGSGFSLSNPLVFNADGNVLGGNGTFGSPVTVDDCVILSPGDSPGNLTFSSGLTFAPGGEYDWQIQSVAGAPTSGAGTNWDLITVSGGTLDIGSLTTQSFTVKLISLNSSGGAGAVSDFDPNLDYSWTIVTSSGGITGIFDASNFFLDSSAYANPLNPGGHFFLTQSGNDLVLNFAAVPEPSTYVLMAAGLGAVLLPVLRRKRRT